MFLIEPVNGVRMLDRTWGSNVYILDGLAPVLVDAGFPLDRKKIVKVLGSEGPELIIATHYHLDHVGPVAALKALYGSRVAAHVEDAPIIKGEKPYEKYRLGALRTLYYRSLAPFYKYKHVEVDLVLEDGDVLDVLGGLEVIHIPGHTDGSIVLFERQMGVLFTGDTIRNEEGVLEGPPPQFSNGFDKALEGIRERLLERDFDVLLPGHGEPVRGGARERVHKMLEDYGKL